MKFQHNKVILQQFTVNFLVILLKNVQKCSESCPHPSQGYENVKKEKINKQNNT